jgi:Xaa-Pro aminopeptidase
MAEMKVGVASSVPSRKAFDVLANGLLHLGIIKDAKDVNRYCPHGVSHPIGLEVHDAGPMSPVYAPGMVLTMEPGLYIQSGSPCDKKYWNIGVRIEDDILITPEGPKRLSAGAPRTVAEIESVMRLKGVGNVPVGSRTSGPQ